MLSAVEMNWMRFLYGLQEAPWQFLLHIFTQDLRAEEAAEPGRVEKSERVGAQNLQVRSWNVTCHRTWVRWD